MSGAVPVVRAMFTLGPGAVAEVVRWPDSELQALRVKLNPGEVVIGPADGPGGAEEFAAFLTGLSETCLLLASTLGSRGGRHSLRRGLNGMGWFTPDPASGGGTTDDLGETGPGRLP